MFNIFIVLNDLKHLIDCDKVNIHICNIYHVCTGDLKP
jgi:hypothetical protein